MNKDTKTVCIVTSIHPDFDTRIMKEARSLVNYGYKIDLICPWSCKNINILGINFLTFKRVQKRFFRFMNYIMISKHLLRKKYNIYHFHDIDLLPLFCIVKFFSRKPIIYDVHENYSEEMLVRSWIPRYLRLVLSFLVKHIQRLLSFYITNLVLISHLQEKEFEKSRYNKIVVRNFASIDLFNKRNNDYIKRKDTIIFTGKQYINSGSLLFLKVGHKVSKIYPSIKFLCIDHFYGNYSLKNHMLFYIRKFNLQKNIIFLDFIKGEEIMFYLNKATIGLLPYLRVRKNIIGISTRLFEYMAAGLPIVASNLPYQKRILNKYECGLIADPNSPDDFAEKISYLIEHKSRAKKMGENGIKAFFEHFSWENEALKLKKFYNLLLR